MRHFDGWVATKLFHARKKSVCVNNMSFLLPALLSSKTFSSVHCSLKQYLLDKDEGPAERERLWIEVRLVRHVPGIQQTVHTFLCIGDPLQVQLCTTDLLEQAGGS